MGVDLSKDEYSATAVFIDILPSVNAIKDLDDIDDETKKENAMNLIIQHLCKSRANCPNEQNSISRAYIAKVRTICSNKEDIDDIIKYLNNAIKAGKNYNGGN